MTAWRFCRLSTLALTIIRLLPAIADDSYGQKSKQMCEEYGKSVYRLEVPPVMFGDPVNVSLCGIAEVSLILGGRLAGNAEFPHMAAIGYGEEANIEWMCGGSLISHDYVLTAAHCLKARGRGLARWVRLGSTRLGGAHAEEGAQLFKVIKGVAHPQFQSRRGYFDLGLLQLDRRATFTKLVRPACLQVGPASGGTAIASGFGLTEYHADEGSQYLMKVSLSLLSSAVCNKTMKGNPRLNLGMLPSQLCAGEMAGGKDTCQGDSGGPLQQVLKQPYCMYSIIGVTSFGSVCGLPNSPAIYTRVSELIPWVEGVVWPHPTPA